MSPTVDELQARRAVEDQAIKLGGERADLTAATTVNTHAIIDLLRDPAHALIPLDHLAQLLGVSRQSLYRWREIGSHIPAGTMAYDWLTERDDDGFFVHNDG